jgi:hypothetical protein
MFCIHAYRHLEASNLKIHYLHICQVREYHGVLVKYQPYIFYSVRRHSFVIRDPSANPSSRNFMYARQYLALSRGESHSAQAQASCSTSTSFPPSKIEHRVQELSVVIRTEPAEHPGRERLHDRATALMGRLHQLNRRSSASVQ